MLNDAIEEIRISMGRKYNKQYVVVRSANLNAKPSRITRKDNRTLIILFIDEEIFYSRPHMVSNLESVEEKSKIFSYNGDLFASQAMFISEMAFGFYDRVRIREYNLFVDSVDIPNSIKYNPHNHLNKVGVIKYRYKKADDFILFSTSCPKQYLYMKLTYG